MELCSEVLDSLQIAGNPAQIPDKHFKPLLLRTIESILEADKNNVLAVDKELSALDQAVLKQAHYGLATLLLEAAKHDREADSVSHTLEDCKFSPDRIEAFSSVYSEFKPHLRILLSSTANSPAHIVDASWRLDHYIKNNQLEKVNQPTFSIQLKTEESGEPGTKDVQFSCTQEQLQDLVGKLRDACKSLDRAAQM